MSAFKIILLAILITGGGFYVWSSMGPTVYRFNANQSLPGRPFPVEFAAEVKEVLDIDEKSSGPKSPSITIHEYKKEVVATNLETGKQLRIQFTAHDYSELGGFKTGEQIAVFGIEPSAKSVFRVFKNPGSRDKAAVNAWMKTLN